MCVCVCVSSCYKASHNCLNVADVVFFLFWGFVCCLFVAVFLCLWGVFFVVVVVAAAAVLFVCLFVFSVAITIRISSFL